MRSASVLGLFAVFGLHNVLGFKVLVVGMPDIGHADDEDLESEHVVQPEHGEEPEHAG